jgi:glycosyltransferase involved in cell wall biosynthesis
LNTILNNKTSNRISVCLITKNEEKNIERCLQSILPLAYEIIVLDTGSTDRTKALTLALSLRERARVRFYETTWEEDFSKARNECISYATGDWIMMIDADEILTEESISKIPLLFEKYNNVENNLIFYFWNYNPDNRGFSQSYFKAALFRSHSGIRFTGSIHEIPTGPDDLATIECPDIIIQHLKTNISNEALATKTKKYINMLLSEINKNPDDSGNYYYYRHLGDAYYNINDFENALKSFLESERLFYQTGYTKIEKIFHENILARIIIVLISHIKNYPLAINYLNQKIAEFPESAERCYFAGKWQNNSGYFKEAIISLKKALDLSGQNINPNIYFELGRALINNGNKSEGLHYLLEAAKFIPEFFPLNIHLLKYYLLEGNLSKATGYYFKTRPGFKPEEKEKFETIAQLPENHPVYKKFLAGGLKLLESSIMWETWELTEIRAKIAELLVDEKT